MLDEDEAFRRQCAAMFMERLLERAEAGAAGQIPELMRLVADTAVIAADALMARLGITTVPTDAAP